MLSTLRRLPGESWHDALLFQAYEASLVIGSDEIIDLAESIYGHYVACGETPEAAADLASHELKLAARTVEGQLP